MLADKKTGDTEIAVWVKGTPNDTPIPEIEVATDRLDDLHDIHFGICSDKFDKYVPIPTNLPPNYWLIDLDNDKVKEYTKARVTDHHGLGPRILDIFNRGGRTAEDTWEAVVYNKSRTRLPSPEFKKFFDEFNDKMIKPGKDVYPVGAKMGGKLVEGERKYEEGAVYKWEMIKRWARSRPEKETGPGPGAATGRPAGAVAGSSLVYRFGEREDSGLAGSRGGGSLVLCFSPGGLEPRR
jgi:hypothetical protein